MSWTNERVELLRKLWGEGRTAAEIAKELGGVTRNAVIGKAHRLKLSNRLSPIQQTKKTTSPATGKTPQEKPVITRKPANNDEPIKVKGVAMADLKDKMCHWPIGDPRDDNFHFCGCPSVPGLPYCASHARIAYQAAGRARALQPEDFDKIDQPNNKDDDAKEVAVSS